MEPESQQLQKIFLQAPSDVQQVLQSPEGAQIVIDIVKRYQISDSIHTLVADIAFLMTGIIHPADFADRLETDLEISEEKARAIAGELNEKIFRGVRESLKKVHHLGKYAEKERNMNDDDTQHIPAAIAPASAKSEPKTAQAPQGTDLLKQKLSGFFILPQKMPAIPKPSGTTSSTVPAVPKPVPIVPMQPETIPVPASADRTSTPSLAASSLPPQSPLVPAAPISAEPAASIPLPNIADDPIELPIQPQNTQAAASPQPLAQKPQPAVAPPAAAEPAPPPIKKMFDPYREPIE